jgi:uncharacterized membrane protein
MLWKRCGELILGFVVNELPMMTYTTSNDYPLYYSLTCPSIPAVI